MARMLKVALFELEDFEPGPSVDRFRELDAARR
jgi:hypothetical protein